MLSSWPGGETAVLAAAEALPFGVAITDPHGTITWANAAYAQAMACTREELPGQSAGPFDWNALAQSAPSSEPWRGEAVCRRKTGEGYSVEHSITPLRNSAAEVTGFWVVKRDTTGLKRDAAAPYQAEANLSALIESTDDLIGSVDLDYSLVTFNRALRDNIEWNVGRQAAVGMPAEEWLPSERFALWPPMFERALSEGAFRTEYTLLDGRTLELSFNPIRQDGRAVGISVFGKDITERKVAEKALREAEREYRGIFEGAVEGIFRTSIEGKALTGNPALAKMLGYESPENGLLMVTDVALQVWLDPDERLRFLKLLQDRGVVLGYECQFKRKDGAAIWVSINCRIVRDADGTQLHIEGFVEDITGRKRMQDALRKSEEKFSTVFLSGPAMTALFKPEADGNRIIDVNEAFEEATGYRREEVIGRTSQEIRFWADPGELDAAMGQLRVYGRVRNLKYHFRRKNGDIRTGLLSTERIELGGAACAVSITIDITEHEKTEEAMRSLATVIEQTSETVVITDLDGTIQYCNPAFEKVTGYAREEVIGQNPRVLKSGKHSQEFYGQLWGTIRQGGVWSGHLINKKKDGSFYEEDAAISPIRDASDNITGFVAVKRDVTERLQLESQLRQAQKLESIGRLAGGVAHDFNNLLTVINGYSGLLAKGLKAGDPLHSYVLEIVNAGERAASLTKQLLAFSRKQVIEPKVFDLNTTIQQALPMLRRLIREDIALETILDDSLGQVKADPDQIHQVILNLAVNARDAMPDGGILSIVTKNVELGAPANTANRPGALPGNYVLLSVSDTGQGMDETTRQHIFEPFFTTKEVGKGTGLGLATVYGIVRQSNGWIELESKVGAGTSFKVYLPRTDSCPAPERSGIGTRTQTGSETILVVEDQPAVRTFTMAALRERGYHVIEASNGPEALAVAGRHPGKLDLLLTDVVMPGMNGKELSERLKELHPKVNVLFISGYSADVIAHRGVLNPGVAFLNKPFSQEELAEKVRAVLGEVPPAS
jgi:PAS domain S-box-containing protein